MKMEIIKLILFHRAMKGLIAYGDRAILAASIGFSYPR